MLSAVQSLPVISHRVFSDSQSGAAKIRIYAFGYSHLLERRIAVLFQQLFIKFSRPRASLAPPATTHRVD